MPYVQCKAHCGQQIDVFCTEFCTELALGAKIATSWWAGVILHPQKIFQVLAIDKEFATSHVLCPYFHPSIKSGNKEFAELLMGVMQVKYFKNLLARGALREKDFMFFQAYIRESGS